MTARGISEISPVSRIAIGVWFGAFPAVILVLLTEILNGRVAGLPVLGANRVAGLLTFAAAGAWLGPGILRRTAEEADVWRIGVWIGALAGTAFVLPRFADEFRSVSAGSLAQAILSWSISALWFDVLTAVVGAFAGWTLWLLVGERDRHSERGK